MRHIHIDISTKTIRIMKNSTKIFAALLLCISVISCVKEKLETTYNKQETQIDTYITKNSTVKRTGKVISKIDSVLLADSVFEYTYSEDSIKTDSILVRIDTTFRVDTTFRDTTWNDSLRVVYNMGSARIIKKEGDGEELGSNGAVSFYYAGYIFSGSVSNSNLFATNHQQTAETSGFSLSDQDFNIFEVNLGETEMLEGLRNGLEGVKAGEECEILFSGKYGFGKHTFGIIPANSALIYKIWVVGVSND